MYYSRSFLVGARYRICIRFNQNTCRSIFNRTKLHVPNNLYNSQ